MKFSLSLTLTATLIAVAGPVLSGPEPFVSGQKLDSGLGSLPHYSQWADRSGRGVHSSTTVIGESLDDGLGNLPHYAKWIDRSGRDPMGVNAVLLSSAQR